MLADKWIFFDRHGEELVSRVASLNIVFKALPPKTRAAKEAQPAPATPAIAPASLISHTPPPTKRMQPDSSVRTPVSELPKRPRLGPIAYPQSVAMPAPQRTPSTVPSSGAFLPREPYRQPNKYWPTPSRGSRPSSSHPPATSYRPPPTLQPGLSTPSLPRTRSHGTAIPEALDMPALFQGHAHQGQRAIIPPASNMSAFTFTPTPSQLHATPDSNNASNYGLPHSQQRAFIELARQHPLPQTSYVSRYDTLPQQSQSPELRQRPYSLNPSSQQQSSYSIPMMHSAHPRPSDAGLYCPTSDTPMTPHAVGNPSSSLQYSSFHGNTAHALPSFAPPASPPPSQTYYDPFASQNMYR